MSTIHAPTATPTPSSALPRLVLALAVAIAVLAAPGRSSAQPSKSEAEHLVPPQGSAADVPVHLGAVCVLSFPEKLSPRALSSSSDFEIQAWGDDGIAVRAINKHAAPSTVALATATGLVKVNVTLRVVPDDTPALTLVRFKAASDAEAFEGRVKTEVARVVEPIQRDLAAKAQKIDALIRERADHEIAERVLRRGDTIKLRTHARNRDHVILHVVRGHVIGEVGYLTYEIQNRSGSPYLLAAVRVTADGRKVTGDVYLASTSPVKGPGLIGAVASGTTARGVVTIPSVNAVLRRPLTLEISMANGRSAVRVERGIELR